MSVYNTVYVKKELFVDKIDGTDFTTTDWAFLGTVDQSLAKANDVEFKTLTLNDGTYKTKLLSGAAADYTLTLPIDAGGNGDVLTTDGNGVLSWNTTGGFDQDLNTTGSPSFSDLTVANTLTVTTGQTTLQNLNVANVGVSNNLTVANNLTVTTGQTTLKDLNVNGDLTVTGTTTIINTTDLAIKDNIIFLNEGEPNSGVSAGKAGIEIDRGLDTNQQLLFVESTDTWTVGLKDGTLGSDAHRLAELKEASPSEGAIPGYDGEGRLSEAKGLTTVEVTQLQNIDTTIISGDQWGYLGNMDQNVAQTGIVQFEKIINTAGIFMIDKSNIYRNVSTLYTTTAAFDAGGWYSINVFDTTNGPISATLPAAVTPPASMTPSVSITIVLMTAGNNLTISRNGTDTIEGDTSITLDQEGQHITVMSLGNGKWILV